jgi:ketosteroid isomerase-like protein
MDEMVGRVKAGYEAFNRGDFDAAAEYYHPEIVWHRVSGIEAPLVGREAVRRNMDPQIFAEQRAEVVEADVVGDCVLVRAVFQIRGAGSGIEMADDAWHLYRIKDGMAIEFRHFTERDEAVAAARGAPSADA